MLALLFFLLCAVCGSVVLSSATTSAGRIAGLGKNRQNYQSVEAAARLLENTLHNASATLQETEKITVTVEHVEKDNDGEGENGEKSEETYTTTTYNFTGPDFLSADDGDSIAFSADNGRNSSLSMLEQLLTDADLSSYMEKGEAYQEAGSIVISDKEDETSEGAESNLSACRQAWQTSFLRDDSTKSVKRHFTMQLSDIDGENSDSMEADSLVEVTLQLYGDGTLELRLCNGDAASSDGEDESSESVAADKYYMLIRGTADVKTQSRSERIDRNADDGDAEDSETLITKKTTITWGDFVITKNAAEAGSTQDSGSHRNESSEEMTENEELTEENSEQ